MAKFRFLPEIATADIAFEAFGKTERAVFENAALALEEAMVETKTVRRRVRETVEMRSTNLPDLLFNFLDHFIFLKDAKQLLFREVKLGVERQGKSFILQGFAYGEKIGPERHKLRADIKALSKDLFEISKTKSGFRAQVILEV